MGAFIHVIENLALFGNLPEHPPGGLARGVRL